MIPSWWTFLLLALATWRVWLLLADDRITYGVRFAISKRSEAVLEWITCPRCFGFWLALAWWAAWLIWPHGAVVAAVPFALSAAVILTAQLADRE